MQPVARRCITSASAVSKTIQLATQENFTFDYVAGEETPQVEVFEAVGKSIVSQCLLGYNGSIFAYGQTGSGKTFTVLGKSATDEESRGLLPRCFEHLFAEMAKIKNKLMLTHKQKLTPSRPSISGNEPASAGKSLYN